MQSRWKIASVNSSLRAKERQQQKLLAADQTSKLDKWLLPLAPVTVPSLPLNNVAKQPESIMVVNSMPVKTERIEATFQPTPALWNIKREFCDAPVLPRPIDRRRDEVNDLPMACGQTTTTLVLQRPVVSTLTQSSSFTTTLPIIGHQDEMIDESKSSIHSSDVHHTNARDTRE